MKAFVIKHSLFLIFLSLITWEPHPPLYPYYIQAGTPVAIQNFIHPDDGCNWDGVGGQVFDRNGQAVSGLVVQIYGLYGGVPIYANVLSGISLKLGPGGYEYKLSSLPASPPGQLTMQVFSVTGEPLSHPVTVTTGGTCESNLLLVNFREVTSLYDLLLPLIRK